MKGRMEIRMQNSEIQNAEFRVQKASRCKWAAVLIQVVKKLLAARESAKVLRQQLFAATRAGES
jgi:hypothetical protein